VRGGTLPTRATNFQASASFAVRLALHVAIIAVVFSSVGHARRAEVAIVRAGEDLQGAIDRAAPGDTLMLEAGATFTGNFVLPRKPGASYITIRSETDNSHLPAADARIFPSDAPLLAKLQSPNERPVLQTAPGAHHWRLLFLEFGPNATPASDIIRLGDGSSQQSSLESVPAHLEIDRCYIHGDAAVGQKRGVALNSAHTRIVNSYFADFKLVGQDTQAIAGWNGPGPFLIENNYLEGAAENVMFGGADPAIPGLVPSDITFRANHVSKPLDWRRERWTVKNLFELKNARRVLIEDNLFEHNWQSAQPGPAILFTPRNQDGTAPWSGIRDVMFRRNIVRHVAAAINILGVDNNHPSATTTNLAIHHNLVVEVDARTWGGSGAFVLLGDAARTISVEHNTVMQSGAVVSVYGRPTTSFIFRNNLVRFNSLGIKGDNRATGNDTLSTYLPGAIVTNNAFGEAPQNVAYPAGNLFPARASWVAQFRDYLAGDYSLASASTFRGAATNGSNLGVDVELLNIANATPSGRR
jgi:hypothetical protein